MAASIPASDDEAGVTVRPRPAAPRAAAAGRRSGPLPGPGRGWRRGAGRGPGGGRSARPRRPRAGARRSGPARRRARRRPGGRGSAGRRSRRLRSRPFARGAGTLARQSREGPVDGPLGILRREAGPDEVPGRDRAVEGAAAVDVGTEAEHGVRLRPGEAARDQAVDQDLAHGVDASAGCSRRRAPPGMNSIPAASRVCWIARTVAGIGVASPPSKRVTVLTPTCASRARSRTPQPSAPRAILHCAAVIIRTRYAHLTLDARVSSEHNVFTRTIVVRRPASRVVAT